MVLWPTVSLCGKRVKSYIDYCSFDCSFSRALMKTLKDFSSNVERIRKQAFKTGILEGLRMALGEITIPTTGNKARPLTYVSRIRELIRKEKEG